MVRARMLGAGFVAVLLMAVLASGCLTTEDDDDGKVKPGDLVTDDESMDLGTAGEVDVYLEQGSGDMTVDGGAAKLMEATFKYNIKQWEPDVTYKEVQGTWNLSVIQPNTDLNVATGAKNSWDVSLLEGVPMDLAINLGAGNADLVLGSLDLTDLDVNVGAGDLDLDLRGYDGDNITVYINCGAGGADLKVPEGIGVRILPILGVGSVSATGFTMVGNEYHNSAYDVAQPHIVVHANLGVGDLVVQES